MAGRNKTIAWNNLKWIKSHLPEWEKRGMSKGFLNSIISPKYKGCEADVESVLTCDIDLFETLYNQPDFLDKLKELCKKYRLPYGKVSQEAENKAEEDLNLIYSQFTGVKKLRESKGKQKSVKDTYKNLIDKGYVFECKIKNISELVNKCNEAKNKYGKDEEGRPNSYATLAFSAGRVEAFVDMVEKGYPFDVMSHYLSLNPKTSIPKYFRILVLAGILNKAYKNAGKYTVNYDVVKFSDNKKRVIFNQSIFG